MTQSRIFVLDTNVLMHDPAALYRFDEHDLYCPMVVLEAPDAAPDVVLEGEDIAGDITEVIAEEVAEEVAEVVTETERVEFQFQEFLQISSPYDI